MSEANKTVVRDCWNAASTGKVSAVSPYYAGDAVYHGAGGEEVRGRANITAFLETYFTAFPDIKMTIEDILAEGDRVFSRVRAQGTNTGDMMGMPPTGKRIDLRWLMNVARIAEGKIQECWWAYDVLGALQQLGVVPVPEHIEA